MRCFAIIFFIIVYGVSFNACSESNSNGSKATGKLVTKNRHLAESVTLDAEVAFSSNGRLSLNGKTNLPDETNLMISLTYDAIGFLAQDSTKVVDGSFSTGPIGPIEGIIPGNYTIEVTMPISSTQPEKVQDIIGKEGEFLLGPLVKDTMWGSKIVEYSLPITIGSQEAISLELRKHNALVDEVLSGLKHLIEVGHFMEQYRNSSDLSASRECGKLMRQYQAEGENLKKKAENLPFKYLELKAATIRIDFCVSCSPSALESCSQVADSLDQF